MLSHNNLSQFEKNFSSNPQNSILSNVISANGLSKLNGVVSENQKYNPSIIPSLPH